MGEAGESLGTEDLIQMVAEGADIPYDQLTDEQLDVLEDKPAADSRPDSDQRESPSQSEAKPTAKQAQNPVVLDKTKCRQCQKVVYETEKVSVSGTLYHKTCFRCAQCNNIVKVTNYCLSPNGEIYCKPHFQQLFKVKGSYNVESSSGALKAGVNNNAAEPGAPKAEDLGEDEEEAVSLPDLKSLKSRFECGGEDSGGAETLVIDKDGGGAAASANSQRDDLPKGGVSTLRNQWANINTSNSENGAASARNEELELCRNASQIRAQFDKGQLFADNDSEGAEPAAAAAGQSSRRRVGNMDVEVVKEEIGYREKPATVAGGLASVKSLWESGNVSSANRNSEPAASRTPDESLQAALAARSSGGGLKSLFQSDSSGSSPPQSAAYEDESLLAARQKRGVAVKSMFEQGGQPAAAASQDSEEEKPTRAEDEELAAIRASRKTNVKAVFENGGAESAATAQINKTFEDESLLAAKSSKGVANKAVFENAKTDAYIRSSDAAADLPSGGAARDLKSKFESGHVNDEAQRPPSEESSSAKEEMPPSAITSNTKAMFEQQTPVTNGQPPAKAG